MDYQDIKKINIRINKNKNIGKVIYIVEGEKKNLIY
mgnify:CR=1 FL=1